MNYIAQKSFCFAGTQYSAGMVFDPSKHPHVCTSRKLQTLLNGRFIKEDFKLPQWERDRKEAMKKAQPAPVAAPAPAPEAPAPEAEPQQDAQQDEVAAVSAEGPKRTKATK